MDSNTVYKCLRATPQLGISQDLYKLTSRLRLGSKPLSLDLRASTLVLELEWVYQSSGEPRESQWMGYSLLYRPQPPNPTIGKKNKKSPFIGWSDVCENTSVGSSGASSRC